MGSSSGYALGVVLSVPFGPQVSSISTVTNRSGLLEGYTSASHGLTSEIGTGWRVQAGSTNQASNTEAGWYYQGSKGLLSADVSATPAQNTLRLGAQGSLVFADRQFFAARRIDDSFAVVKVAGYGGVGVGFQGSTLTRTDSNGTALLTRLMPYQSNSIRLDPTELPISAELDTIEEIAVPATRSAVKIVFPVRSGRGALLRIVLENGDMAPAGAQLHVVGDSEDFFVARRGEAFVTGLKDHNTLELKSGTLQCHFTLTLPPGKLEDIARIGPLTCIPTQPQNPHQP
ncbi:outer membrane usher protein HtrE precursor [mine drainage metagenome]|uniref:Outer membrane usher protein HtrE n=1 Tax=mine drainage metagenome TaxID=410659 RepID=A0A1J5PYI3_9ZZZZ